MTGILIWVGCGVLASWFMSQLISANEKGSVLLTNGVGVAGAVAGGFIASLLGFGDGATFSIYGSICATLGAFLALCSYRRMVQA